MLRRAAPIRAERDTQLVPEVDFAEADKDVVRGAVGQPACDQFAVNASVTQTGSSAP
jgi:hypothetical protein